MIVVVEGISAAGKTSWCRRNGVGHLVEESQPKGPVPDRETDPRGAARFWTEENARRWRLARDIEQRTGLAICDTDPLKLHYSFCLSRIGGLAREHWLFERDLAREFVAAGRIGFADLYLVRRIDPDQARAQRDSDTTRRRRNFDLHVRLEPPLMEYYRAIEAILPGRVAWSWPADGVPAVGRRDREEDLALFDALMKRLA